MSRLYTVMYQGTVTNAGGDSDLLEVLPADDKPVRLRGWIIGQTSEVGDAAEENLRITLRRMTATVTSGSGGSAVTPLSLDETMNVAFGGTVECNNTTVATTSGTSRITHELSWNERYTPWEFWFPEVDFCPVARQAEGLFMRMESTPADDFSITMTFYIEEF